MHRWGGNKSDGVDYWGVHGFPRGGISKWRRSDFANDVIALNRFAK